MFGCVPAKRQRGRAVPLQSFCEESAKRIFARIPHTAFDAMVETKVSYIEINSAYGIVAESPQPRGTSGEDLERKARPEGLRPNDNN